MYIRRMHQRIKGGRARCSIRNVVIVCFAFMLLAPAASLTSLAIASETTQRRNPVRTQRPTRVQRVKRWFGNRLKTAPVAEATALAVSQYAVGNSVVADVGHHSLAFLLGMAPRTLWKASGGIGKALFAGAFVVAAGTTAAIVHPEAAAWVAEMAAKGGLLVGEHGSAAVSWGFKMARENNAAELVSGLAGHVAPTLPSFLAGMVTSLADTKPVRGVVNKLYWPASKGLGMLKKKP